MYNKLILITAALVLLSSCSSTPPPTPQETMPEPTNTVTKEAPQLPVDAELLSGKQTVTLKTSLGDMTLELDADAAPKTVTNFVTLAKDGYYDDLIFHRVIEDFMIQSGSLYPNGDEKPTGPAIINESLNRLSHLRGTIAMARMTYADTATSGFFINLSHR